MLLVLAIVSAVASAAYMVATSTTKVTTDMKLQQDVATLNKAITSYRIGGGSLAGVQYPGAVLAKLKTEASNAREIAAINGSKLDSRFRAVLGTGTGDKVAYWDLQDQVFKITSPDRLPQGATAISEFKLDAATSPAEQTETRTAALKLAQEDKWVWDYNEAYTNRIPIRTPVVASNVPVQGANELVTDQLYTPLLSVAPGTHPLSMFPLDLGITNPNPSGISRLMFSQNNQPWREVTGVTTLLPGQQVTAFAQANNVSEWSDSEPVSGLYNVQRVKLMGQDDVPATMSYLEIGGPMERGSIERPVTRRRLWLQNHADIPEYWENHTTFQMYWTLNGTPPDTDSPARIPGNNTFTRTYPGDDFMPALTDFTGPQFALKYFLDAKNETVVIDSDVVSKTVTAAKLTLPPPLVTPGSRSLSGMEPVTMNLDHSAGNVPAGARIFYRADGQDPGQINGEPGAGALLYNGPFMPDPGLSPVVTIIARTYPPAGRADWFHVSAPTSQRYFLVYGDKNIYAVQNSDRNLYALDATSGASVLVDNTAPFNPRAIALDAQAGFLYYVESASNNWRLGRFDIIQNVHVSLGALNAAPLLYKATAQPQNLVFHNGAVYYLHANSDDLIRVRFNATAITDAARVANVADDALSFVKVGDLAVDSTGWMFFADSAKNYYRFDLNTFSGLKQLGTAERDYDALAMFQAQLFGSDDGSADMRRL